MTYENFTTYPLQILGIDESYNDELTAINDFVIEAIAYTGDVDDLTLLLPYFVFCAFCENKKSTTGSQTGETAIVKEFTINSDLQFIKVWNTAVTKLNALCTKKTQTANEKYLSKIYMI